MPISRFIDLAQGKIARKGMKCFALLVVSAIAFVAWALNSAGSPAEKATADDQRLLPAGPLGEAIRLGQELVDKTATHPLTKPYVGNALNCRSCHLNSGTHPRAGSFLGVAAAYPAWSPRERRVITLEDRILNCFMRSCNGIRPPLGSKISVSIAAYITWLSAEQPIRMNPDRPAGPRSLPALETKDAIGDVERGRAVYSARCANCHGDEGQGDDENPPVWGLRSFNDGAGLANNLRLASWLKEAMPPDEADLSDQESLDAATFINSHKRPAFQLREHLPAKDALGEYNSESFK